MDDIQLASTARRPTVRPGELPQSRPRSRQCVLVDAAGRPAMGFVAADDLAYCWRSRTLLVLGAADRPRFRPPVGPDATG
jgi:hypothetical protein